MRSSLWLDVHFLKVSGWPLTKKLTFLAVKYKEIFLLISKIKTFELGKSYVKLFGKEVYYDSPYGIAGYQSMLTRHQRMLREAGPMELEILVDVGANVGFYSMMVKEIEPGVRVFALEPIPQTFAALSKNLDEGQPFNFAVSDTSVTVRMIFEEKNSALSSVVPVDAVHVSNTIEVPAITLDEFCAANNITKIDLLKIDTESFEAHVLRGAAGILNSTRYLSIEISIESNSNYTFSEINSLLFSKNYNFQLINFRNYADKGYGPLPVGDFLYKNVNMFSE